MSESLTRTTLEGRGEQMFPRLTPAEIDRLRRFGQCRSFKAGEMLVRAGEEGHGLTILLSGQVEILQHDETGRRISIAVHETGSFMGELAQLSGRPAGPVVAATDYMRAFAEQIRPSVPADRRYVVLGTDGFGRSDYRKALRRHFEVDRQHVVVATLAALAADGTVPASAVTDAITRYDIDPDKLDPARA